MQKEKPLFTETAHCQTRVHCHACRDLNGGRKWRTTLQRLFRLPDDKIDFECPKPPAAAGHPWDFDRQPVKTGQQPKPTVKKAIKFMEAMLTAGRVSDEIRLERTSICLACPHRRQNKKGADWCGVCGCRFSADHRELQNLAAYNEGKFDKNGLPEWGCRHPDRKTGSGWKR
jgi:hypothetical protein